MELKRNAEGKLGDAAFTADENRLILRSACLDYVSRWALSGVAPNAIEYANILNCRSILASRNLGNMTLPVTADQCWSYSQVVREYRLDKGDGLPARENALSRRLAVELDISAEALESAAPPSSDAIEEMRNDFEALIASLAEPNTAEE
jgi:hypothetical protein